MAGVACGYAPGSDEFQGSAIDINIVSELPTFVVTAVVEVAVEDLNVPAIV